MMLGDVSCKGGLNARGGGRVVAIQGEGLW